MKKLLQFELYKLKKQKSLYICFAVVLAMTFLNVLANFVFNKEFGAGLSGSSPTAVGMMLSAASSSDLNLILSIFIVLYVCGDFNQKTIKNIYSRGFSRTEVYFAKFIVCIAYVTVVYIITELFSLAVGSAFFGFKPQGGNIGWLITGQLFACWAYAALVFAVCIMVKRMGIAFAIVLVAPAVISVVLTLADVVVMVASGAETLNPEKFMFSDFWLDGMLSSLSSATASVKKIVIGNVLPFVYGAVFVVASFFVNRKTEV